MHRTAAITAIVLASVAHADSVTIEWHSQYTSSDTVRVWADLTFEPDQYTFSGFASSMFDVIGTDDAYTQSINHNEAEGLGRLFQYAGTSAGTTAGDDILGIEQFQLPEVLNTGYNGDTTISEFFVFEYQITDFTARTVQFTSHHDWFRVYDTDSGHNIDYDWVSVPTSFDIAVVPLPTTAAMGALGLGLVCMVSRRNGRL